MTEFVEKSAGSVLFRIIDKKMEVCLIQVATRGGNASWRLPKGSMEYSETPEETAIRETQEETGCAGEVISTLSDIEYWFTRRDMGQPQRIHKIVHFFLLQYESGDVANHDDEVDDVKWYPIGDALKAISYEAEGRVLQEAIHSWDAHLYRQGLL